MELMMGCLPLPVMGGWMAPTALDRLGIVRSWWYAIWPAGALGLFAI